nr:reverse transcriptase domain-containing protein [Tanacetum cinerariifolium]
MDDEPMWAVDHVVAPTPDFAITIPKTANKFVIKGNHLTLVKENQFDGRTKTNPHKHIHESLRICDSEITQEVLNAAAGGIFLYKTPNQAYQLLKYKVLLKLDWAKNQKSKSSLKKTVAFADESSSNFDTDKLMARMDSMTLKMDALLADKQSGRPSESLPSNTQPNPKEHNSKAYQPPQARNERVNVVFTRSGKSYNPSDNPNDQQKETPINFDSDDEDDEPTPQPKTQDPEPAKENPFSIDVIDEILEEDFDALSDEGIKILHSIEGTPLEEETFAEFKEFMAMTTNENSDSESDIE